MVISFFASPLEPTLDMLAYSFPINRPETMWKQKERALELLFGTSPFNKANTSYFSFIFMFSFYFFSQLPP